MSSLVLALHDSLNAACKAHNTVELQRQIDYRMQHYMLICWHMLLYSPMMSRRGTKGQNRAAQLQRNCRFGGGMQKAISACTHPACEKCSSCNTCSVHPRLDFVAGHCAHVVCREPRHKLPAMHHLLCAQMHNFAMLCKNCSLSKSSDTLRPLAMLSHSSAPPVAQTPLKKLVIAPKPCLFTKSETSVSFGPSSMSLYMTQAYTAPRVASAFVTCMPAHWLGHVHCCLHAMVVAHVCKAAANASSMNKMLPCHCRSAVTYLEARCAGSQRQHGIALCS